MHRAHGSLGVAERGPKRGTTHDNDMYEGGASDNFVPHGFFFGVTQISPARFAQGWRSVLPLQCLKMETKVAVEGVEAGEAVEGVEVDEETETTDEETETTTGLGV